MISCHEYHFVNFYEALSVTVLTTPALCFTADQIIYVSMLSNWQGADGWESGDAHIGDLKLQM